MVVDAGSLRDAFRRGWLGGAELRMEDEQKLAELAALLGEVARLQAKMKVGAKVGADGGHAFHLVDACGGKGALGVLASAFVLRGRKHVVTVLDRDARFADRCATAAAALSVTQTVKFVAGSVDDTSVWPASPNPAAPTLVVALHACGGASDAVIDAVIRTDARALLLVPCCYGAGPRHDGAGLAVRAQPMADAWAARLPLPAHGLIGRRVAQTFIDAERTLRLEAAGYETEVVEVFASTLSPHNLLWRARRVKEPVRMERARETLEQLSGEVRAGRTSRTARSRR